MTIKLGADLQWFTAVTHPGFEYLGTVQRGLELGALARLEDGTYVQVNGDIVQPLNTSRVEASLADARPKRIVRKEPSAPPVVVVKRKRTIVMPTAE